MRILASVKDLSIHQESIVQTFLQVTGHENYTLSEEDDFVNAPRKGTYHCRSGRLNEH